MAGGGQVGMPYTEVDRWILHLPHEPPWTAKVTFQTRAGPESPFSPPDALGPSQLFLAGPSAAGLGPTRRVRPSSHQEILLADLALTPSCLPTMLTQEGRLGASREGHLIPWLAGFVWASLPSCPGA